MERFDDARALHERAAAGTDSVPWDLDRLFRSRLCELVDREMKRRLGSGANPRIIADLVSAVQTDVGGMTLTGTIDFLGTEVLVEGEVMLRDGARLVGTGGFDVRWWGLEPPRLLMLRVDPIVTVEIDLPLIAQPQPEAT